MDSDLEPIKAALSGLDTGELIGLIGAAGAAPQVAPALLAWLQTACHWEFNRREGNDYELFPPQAAVGDDECALSIEATTALRAVFWSDTPAVRALFDELEKLLTGGGPWP